MIKSSEHEHQKTVIEWARANQHLQPCLRWLYAIPNAAKRSHKLSKMMRSEGLTAGILDLCLPAARQGYHGLYIEMKYGDNKPTPEQIEFMDYLVTENYCKMLCYTCDEAINILTWYLGMKR